jgi:hypothetical protein
VSDLAGYAAIVAAAQAWGEAWNRRSWRLLVRAEPDQEKRDVSIPHDRFFIDESGTEWRVFEKQLADNGECLIFDSSMAYRRVNEYPPDWRTLSPADLRELSWRR